MILIAGCGGLGSRIALELAGQQLRLVDDDVVEPENIHTGMFFEHHIGVSKAVAVSGLCAARGIYAEFRYDTLTEINVPAMISGCDLVVDCLDNAGSRMLLTGISVPTLHVGVGLQRTGLVVWDQAWVPPAQEFARGENPVCTRMAGALILQMTAVAAIGIINRWLVDSVATSAVVTETSIRVYS